MSAKREVLYVLYDLECALCTGTVEKLRTMPARAELRYVPLQELESEAPPDVPGRDGLRMDRLYEKLHVVDGAGRAFAGADAIVRIMRTMPMLRWLAWCYAIPGARAIADMLYRYVARRRYDWFGKTDQGCAGGACALPVKPQSTSGRNEEQ